MQLKTVFFGSGLYTLPIIDKLQNYGLQLIVTTESDPTSSRIEENKYISYLKSLPLPYISTHLKNKEDREHIQSLNADIGVLASYGAILPKDVIDIFPLGIINVHPSLLPKYKGPTPIQTTILNGDKETGTTIIQLDDKVDHGPILAQETVSLSGTETTQELKNTLFKLGAEMIDDALEEIQKNEEIISHPQDHTKEVFTRKVSREDGYIDLSNPPSKEEIDRKVRAFFPWPGVFFTATINGTEKRIKLLPHEHIQVEGKKEMSYKDFRNGYPEGKTILERLSS